MNNKDKLKVGRPRLADTDLKKKSLIISGIMLLVSIALLAGGLISLNILPRFNKLKGEVVCTLNDIPENLRPGRDNEYGFDDANFYSAVVNSYSSSTNNCTSMDADKLATIGSFSARNKQIESTNGIQYLTGLSGFDLHGNNLTSVDLSYNTALNDLDLSNNNLTSIDLSHNTSLISLHLFKNNISTIDLTHNTRLTSLHLSNNQLSEIDLSQNTALYSLGLNNNNLSSIDLSKNKQLRDLYLNNNQLSEIDLSQNTHLYDVNLKNNNLSSITLGDNEEIGSLYLNNNNLSGELNLSNLTNLGEVRLAHNKLENVIFSGSLGAIILIDNNIKTIDLSNLESIMALLLQDNPMENTKYVLKGNNIEYVSPIILNDNYQITYAVEDENVATYENGILKGLKEGTTNIKLSNKNIISVYPEVYDYMMMCEEDDNNPNCTEEKQNEIYQKYNMQSEDDMYIPYFLSQEIKVYDVKSDKYSVNTTKKEIDVKGKDIKIEDIDLGLEGLSGVVEGDNYIIKDGDTIVDTYKLVNMKKEEIKPSDADNNGTTTTNNNKENITKKKVKVHRKIFNTTKEEIKTTTNIIINKIINKDKGATTTKVVVKKDNKCRWIWWPILLIILIIGYIIYKKNKNKDS